MQDEREEHTVDEVQRFYLRELKECFSIVPRMLRCFADPMVTEKLQGMINQLQQKRALQTAAADTLPTEAVHRLIAKIDMNIEKERKALDEELVNCRTDLERLIVGARRLTQVEVYNAFECEEVDIRFRRPGTPHRPAISTMVKWLRHTVTTIKRTYTERRHLLEEFANMSTATAIDQLTATVKMGTERFRRLNDYVELTKFFVTGSNESDD